MKIGIKLLGNVWFWISAFFLTSFFWAKNFFDASGVWITLLLLSLLGLLISIFLSFYNRKWIQGTSGFLLILGLTSIAIWADKKVASSVPEAPKDLSLEKFKLSKHELLLGLKNWSCLENFENDSTNEKYFRVDSIVESDSVCGMKSAFFIMVGTNAQGYGCTSFASWYTDELGSWKRKMDFGSIGDGGSLQLVDFNGTGQCQVVIYGGVERIGSTEIFGCEGRELKVIFKNDEGYRGDGFRVANENGRNYLVNFHSDTTSWWCEACQIYFGEPYLLQGKTFVRQPDAYADLALDSNKWTSFGTLAKVPENDFLSRKDVTPSERAAGQSLLARYDSFLGQFPKSSVLLFDAATIAKKIGDIERAKTYQGRILKLDITIDPCRFCNADDKQRRQDHLDEMKKRILDGRR
jgi:hypothetical protein